MCQLSLHCAETTDPPESTSYAWDISHTLVTTYHPYSHSPSALTEYLKQKLCQQQAKRLSHSHPALVKPDIPLECNKRYLEVDNEAESASSTVALKVSGIKCKAENNLPGHCATCKSITTVVSNNASNDRAPSPSLPPTEPASDNYESLQAMADANNQVRSQ